MIDITVYGHSISCVIVSNAFLLFLYIGNSISCEENILIIFHVAGLTNTFDESFILRFGLRKK